MEIPHANRKSILISGGSGLIGSQLTRKLQELGYEVRHLSRSSGTTVRNVEVYKWSPADGYIDEKALDNIDCIIHLAGANIGSNRWTPSRKQEIIDSRAKTAELIGSHLEKGNHKLSVFISAGAIGIYGDHGDSWIFEETPSSIDFIGKTGKAWEDAAKGIRGDNTRKVILRIGLVVAPNTLFLQSFLKTKKLGMFPYLGSGKQYYSWISLEDVCRMFIWSIENEKIIGTYNAVAPESLTAREFSQIIRNNYLSGGKVLKVPGFIIRALYGELGSSLLSSIRVSARKILGSGFKFTLPTLDEAIKAGISGN